MNGVSDLHNGTDIRGDFTYLVYPMFNAKIFKVTQPGSVNNGNVILQYDIDKNGVYDNYYVQYMHILPDPNIYEGKVITPL